MQQATEAYARAIVGSVRRIVPRAILDIVDPDISYGSATSNSASPYAKPDQLHNKEFTATYSYATLERNRWMLDGAHKILPANPADTVGEVGYWCEVQGDDEGRYTEPLPYVHQPVTNLSILQAAAVHFFEEEGLAADFAFEIYSGDTVVYHKEITGNTDTVVYFDGFTVYGVTGLRVTFRRWSLPRRRPRLAEIVPGIYERWEGDTIYTLDILQETDFSCMRVPYGSCTLAVHNAGKRFNAYNRSGVLKSIEARQGLPVFLGAELEDRTVEYLPAGVYYQQDGGWDINGLDITITFRLVDIVGLLASRKFESPDTLPTTLAGWISAIVAHLGENFTDHSIVAPSIADTPMVVNAADDLKNATCGNVLRYACMAAGAIFRADPATGFLRVEPLPTALGSTITLDNMHEFPTASARDEVADVTIKVYGTDATTEYKAAGTLTASSKSLSIANPFIHTTAQAAAAARAVLIHYGGLNYTVKGRGDMRCELGDIDAAEADFGQYVGGRRYKQQFSLKDGVMTTAPSYLEQAAGESLYQHREIVVESGTWTVPEKVTNFRAVLVGGGQGGQPGASGDWSKDGAGGAGGQGGKVLVVDIAANPGTTYAVQIGAGGTADVFGGNQGGPTTFGAYSSAQGTAVSYGDLMGGAVYALPGDPGAGSQASVITGAAAPTNSGNGGQGGSGGMAGLRGTDNLGHTYIRRHPVPGGTGGPGGSGCVIIYYEEANT